MASFYGPIIFFNQKILIFNKKTVNGGQLISSGTFLKNDPNKIILKRVTLTAIPKKIHKKKKVVARFMFFNPKQINFYKPVELSTKYGARGHIKDSIGTHGSMKCIFNQNVKPNDVIGMHLYKRTYPKWTY